MTTVYPIYTTGVHGNSGDKTAGKHLFGSGKGRKRPEISENRYSCIVWEQDAAGSSPVTSTIFAVLTANIQNRKGYLAVFMIRKGINMKKHKIKEISCYFVYQIIPWCEYMDETIRATNSTTEFIEFCTLSFPKLERGKMYVKQIFESVVRLLLLNALFSYIGKPIASTLFFLTIFLVYYIIYVYLSLLSNSIELSMGLFKIFFCLYIL